MAAMFSTDAVMSTESFRQQWDGSKETRSHSLSLFEQQFECEVGMEFEEWLQGAVYLGGEFEDDFVLYQRGATQLFQDAYDQVWVVSKISHIEEEL